MQLSEEEECPGKKNFLYKWFQQTVSSPVPFSTSQDITATNFRETPGAGGTVAGVGVMSLATGGEIQEERSLRIQANPNLVYRIWWKYEYGTPPNGEPVPVKKGRKP